jgi:hypothetical protein
VGTITLVSQAQLEKFSRVCAFGLQALPEEFLVAGSYRLGIAYRDIDLFCAAEEGAERNPAKATPTIKVVQGDVNGWPYGWLESALPDGMPITLCVLPATQSHLQNLQYQQACCELIDPQQRELFLFMRSIGLKHSAYYMVGVWYLCF